MQAGVEVLPGMTMKAPVQKTVIANAKRTEFRLPVKKFGEALMCMCVFGCPLMFVCMCACVCLFLYICVCVCIFVFVCVYLCLYVYICVCISVYMCTYLGVYLLCVCVHVCLCVCSILRRLRMVSKNEIHFPFSILFYYLIN